jgi:hypothetical protein
MKNTPMYTTLAALLLAIAAFSPAQAQQAPELPADWPDWLKQDMSREADIDQFTPFSVAGEAFRGRVPGKLSAKPVEDSGSWYLASRLPDAGLMECWVFEEEQDPATLMRNLGQYVVDASVQGQGQATTRQLFGVSADVIGGIPLYTLEWLYTVGEAPDTLVGLAKLRSAQFHGFTLACSHNSLGFRQTFSRVFEQLVASVQSESGTPLPYFEEVYLLSIGGSSVGFSRESFVLDEEGDTEITSLESMLVAVDAVSLSTSDTWGKSYSNAKGELINAYESTVENGELTVDMALGWSDGGWVSSGTLQGKEFSATIDGPELPGSSLAINRAVRELVASEADASTSFHMWLPSVDPGNFFATTLTIDKPGNTGVMTQGPLEFDLVYGASGTLESATADLGGVMLRLDRVWHRGEIPGK